MKNPIIITTLFLSSIFLINCTTESTTDATTPTPVKEEDSVVLDLNYSSRQNAIIQDFTSTGCSGCGSWGAPTFNAFVKANPTVIPIGVHIKYGDPMITNESNELGNNRVGSKWTPQISIGTTQCVLINSSNSIDGNGSIKKLNEEFASLEAKSSTTNIAATYTIKDDKLILKTGVEYLDENATEEYFMARYVMENGIMANQARGLSNIHDHVIRASADGAFGHVVHNMKKHEMYQDFEIKDSWTKENLYAILVIWKKNGNVYEFVNAITAEKQ